jgi:hypothetical protein
MHANVSEHRTASEVITTSGSNAFHRSVRRIANRFARRRPRGRNPRAQSSAFGSDRSLFACLANTNRTSSARRQRSDASIYSPPFRWASASSGTSRRVARVDSRARANALEANRRRPSRAFSSLARRRGARARRANAREIFMRPFRRLGARVDRRVASRRDVV